MAFLYILIHLCLVWKTEAFVESHQLFPVDAKISSIHPCSRPKMCGPAKFCIDSDMDTMCNTGHGPDVAPWIALIFSGPVWVDKVEIINLKDGNPSWVARLRNVEVRITNTIPTNGDRMFSQGVVLGNFTGPGTNGQVIQMEGTPKQGMFVLVQMNHKDALNLMEIRVFGSYAFETMGKNIARMALEESCHAETIFQTEYTCSKTCLAEPGKSCHICIAKNIPESCTNAENSSPTGLSQTDCFSCLFTGSNVAVACYLEHIKNFDASAILRCIKETFPSGCEPCICDVICNIPMVPGIVCKLCHKVFPQTKILQDTQCNNTRFCETHPKYGPHTCCCNHKPKQHFGYCLERGQCTGTMKSKCCVDN